MPEEAPTTERPSMSEMAEGLFGENFYGEVTKPPEETETKETGPESEEEAETEETGEETETEEGAEEETKEETTETEGPEYELSDIAELLGLDETQLDVNDDGKVVIVSKVDGETKPLAIKHMLDNAQMNEAADKRLEQAKAKAQSQTQEFEQRQEQLQRQFVQAAKLIETAETLLDKDAKSVNMAKLREDDPAEYSAKMAETQERRREIDRMKQEAVEAYNQSVSSASPTPEQIADAQKVQREQLLERVPEWKDQSVFKEQATKIPAYLSRIGFANEEVEAIVGSNRFVGDSRLVDLARRAMLRDDGQAKTAAAKKKVVKVPKITKPGTSKPKEQADKEKIERYSTRLSESGDIKDAFALMQAKKQK
jgi:hypothetical protein